MQTLPQHCKETIKHFDGNLNNIYIQDHHLIKCNTIYSLEKLNKRELLYAVAIEIRKTYVSRLSQE